MPKKKSSQTDAEIELRSEQKYRRALRVLIGPIRFLWRVRVSGDVSALPEGGCLICPNHISFADIPVLSCAFPDRPLHYMAKKEIFRFKPFGNFIRSVGAYPVNRGGGDIGAVKTTIALLKEGKTAVIFPQGHRNPGADPRTTEVHGGAMLIARRAEVPIVPVFLKTKNRRCLLFRPVEVIVGPPVSPEELSAYGTDNTSAMREFFLRTCEMEESGQWN